MAPQTMLRLCIREVLYHLPSPFYTGANGASEGRNAVIAETARLAAEVLVKHVPKFQMQSHQVSTRRVK
jgi:hypothetical protein